MQPIRPDHIRGIDVSRHQPSLDWHKVRASGVAFVYMKATEGATYRDPKLEEHYRGARGADLQIGFYHYARPYNDPAAEVGNLLRTTAELRHGLPFALDIETNEGTLGREQVTTFCVRWLEELERRTGERPMVYTYTHFAKSWLGKELGRWPLWIAHYGVDRPGANGVWQEWSMFQYTDNGRVPGYGGPIDCNVMEAAMMKREERIFADVPGSHPFAADIRYVRDRKLLVGKDDGRFCPDEPVTRAQLAAVLHRLAVKGEEG